MNTLFKLALVIKTIVNFPTAILDRLGLLRGEVVYRIRKNSMQFIARSRTEDLAEIAVVASGSEYDMKSIKLPSRPIIVDLGGHIGTFSIPIATMLKDKCKIYTYEPDKENYRILRQNITLNNIHSINPVNLAISDYVGKGYLKTKEMNTDAYYLEPSQKKKSNCLVSTLPYEFKKYKVNNVDLLKMDIEGGEENIFVHDPSLKAIKDKVRYIFIEVSPVYESSRMKGIIDKNFRTIHRHKNVLTLENVHLKL